MTASTPPAPDAAAIGAMLRAMAPDSYAAALRALRYGVLGLLGLIASIVATVLSSGPGLALGLLLISVIAPLLTLRWWRITLAPRVIALAGLAVSAITLLGAVGALTLAGVWWGALILASAALLIGHAAHHALNAWRNLGPLRGMISPSMIAAVAGTQN